MADDNVFAPSSASMAAPRSGGGDGAPAADLDLMEIFSRAFDLLRNNLGLFAPALGVLFVGTLINVALQIASYIPVEEEWLMLAIALGSAAIQLLIALVNFTLSLGVVKMALAIDRGQEASVDMMTSSLSRFPMALGTGLLIGLAFLLGLCMCIVPGLIVGVMFAPLVVVVVDREDLGFAELLQETFQLTEGHLVLLFVQMVLFAVGNVMMACCTLGLATPFVTLYMLLVQVVTYRALRAA